MFNKDKKKKEEKNEESDDKVFSLLDKGWIRCECFMELMAVKKDVTEKAMKEHINKIRKEEGIYVASEDYKDVNEIDNPPGKAKTAFSLVTELDILFRNYAMLVYFVTNYGPSSLDIIEPKEIVMGQGEATAVANSLASLVHQFAAQGAGGIVFSNK